MKSRFFAPFIIGALLACGSGSSGDSSVSGDDSATTDSAAANDTSGSGSESGADTTVAGDTGSAGSDTSTAGDTGGDANPFAAYPPGPYGINAGDTIPNLAWEGYVNPTAADVSTKQTFGPTSLQDLRPTAKKGYALIHVAEFT